MAAFGLFGHHPTIYVMQRCGGLVIRTTPSIGQRIGTYYDAIMQSCALFLPYAL